MNVLFWNAVAQIGILDKDIRLHVIPLIEFTGQSVNFSSIIGLPVKINSTSWHVEFLVIDAPSSYNGLLGQPALNQLKATVSTFLLTLEMQTSTELFAIRGDQLVGQECFLAAKTKVEHSW